MIVVPSGCVQMMAPRRAGTPDAACQQSVAAAVARSMFANVLNMPVVMDSDCEKSGIGPQCVGRMEFSAWETAGKDTKKERHIL